MAKDVPLNKRIEVVQGNAKELNISKVHTHLKIERHGISNNKKKGVIIPKSKKK